MSNEKKFVFPQLNEKLFEGMSEEDATLSRLYSEAARNNVDAVRDLVTDIKKHKWDINKIVPIKAEFISTEEKTGEITKRIAIVENCPAFFGVARLNPVEYKNKNDVLDDVQLKKDWPKFFETKTNIAKEFTKIEGFNPDTFIIKKENSYKYLERGEDGKIKIGENEKIKVIKKGEKWKLRVAKKITQKIDFSTLVKDTRPLYDLSFGKENSPVFFMCSIPESIAAAKINDEAKGQQDKNQTTEKKKNRLSFGTLGRNFLTASEPTQPKTSNITNDAEQATPPTSTRNVSPRRTRRAENVFENPFMASFDKKEDDAAIEKNDSAGRRVSFDGNTSEAAPIISTAKATLTAVPTRERAGTVSYASSDPERLRPATVSLNTSRKRDDRKTQMLPFKNPDITLNVPNDDMPKRNDDVPMRRRSASDAAGMNQLDSPSEGSHTSRFSPRGRERELQRTSRSRERSVSIEDVEKRIEEKKTESTSMNSRESSSSSSEKKFGDDVLERRRSQERLSIDVNAIMRNG
jgi:hypothetical protein